MAYDIIEDAITAKEFLIAREGSIIPTPTQDLHIANKKYVDDSIPVASDFAHNSLSGLNDGTDYEHITQTQKTKLDGIETGAEVNNISDVNASTLTDDSMADTLHRHSELSASDGSPNPALSVDASGIVNITNQSYIKANRASTQAITNGTWTKIQYNTEVTDNQGEYDATDYTFTAKTDGNYLVIVGVLMASVAWTSGNSLRLAISKNGSYESTVLVPVQSNFTGYMQGRLVDIISLSSEDEITGEVYHDRGADTNIHSNAKYNTLTIQKLS